MSKRLSPLDRTHLEECGLNPQDIGRWCGAGAGHDVYDYGEVQVVKIPKIRWIKERLSIITAEDAKQSLRVLEMHFREYSLRSSVHPSRRGSSYCILQQRLGSFENLTSAHLRANKSLASQLNDILLRNKRLSQQHGKALDFLGKEGCIQTALSSVFAGTPQMSNLVVVGHGVSARIVIVDSNMFSLSSRREKHLPRKWMNDAGKCSHMLNTVLVEGVFGADARSS